MCQWVVASISPLPGTRQTCNLEGAVGLHLRENARASAIAGNFVSFRVSRKFQSLRLEHESMNFLELVRWQHEKNFFINQTSGCLFLSRSARAHAEAADTCIRGKAAAIVAVS